MTEPGARASSSHPPSRTPASGGQDGLDPSSGDEPPPLFKSWSSWYALVLGTLILLIILFYVFTKSFS